MSFQTAFINTDLPKNIIEIIENDLQIYDDSVFESKINKDKKGGELNHSIRKSKNFWIPTSHWIGGFCWHYVMKANRENFLYDLTCFDENFLQYTHYSEGEFYNWHTDSSLATYYKPTGLVSSSRINTEDNVIASSEYVRKLSFTLQLSDPEDYRGGEVQFMDETGKSYFMSKKRGSIAIFDSRTPHRVRKVKSGLRKSLVGWVLGPRWK